MSVYLLITSVGKRPDFDSIPLQVSKIGIFKILLFFKIPPMLSNDETGVEIIIGFDKDVISLISFINSILGRSNSFFAWLFISKLNQDFLIITRKCKSKSPSPKPQNQVSQRQ